MADGDTDVQSNTVELFIDPSANPQSESLEIGLDLEFDLNVRR